MIPRPGDLSVDEIRDILEEIDNASDDSMDFRVIQHADDMMDASRPLMVIIHPGDMIELDHDPDALEMQDGLATEMEARQNFDLVILHRNSCSQIGNVTAERCCHEMGDRFEAEWPRATILHGDDLEAASAWMVSNLGLEGRPEIFMGGAYGGIDFGCLTFVGKNIEEVTDTKIVLSAYIPLGGEDPWLPRSREDQPQP